MPTTTKQLTPASTETYASAYARLTAIAERLRTATTAATIDSLVAEVRGARDAHATCRDRLEAVRREIDAEVAAEEGEAPTPR